MKYRSEIDGLRAVAVIPVVLFHAGLPSFSGGYVGVDVFFVISGFLITSMIAAEARDHQFSLLRFYDRRIRRIFPAYVTVALVVAAIAWFVIPPFDFSKFGQSLVASSGFGSNVLFWAQDGYFDAPAHLKPLLHTWSLSVEEQFYVAFPLILVALFRWQRRHVGVWVVAGLGISLAACIWMTARDASTAFYQAPLRGWELLAGSVLALEIVPSTSRRLVRESAGVGGVLAIGAAVALYSSSTRFPGYHAILPCGGAVLVIYAGQSTVGRMLSWAPLVFIGKISYSLYLWHWPLLVLAVFFNNGKPSTAYAITAIGIAALASVLSWRFVEQPFRTRRISRARLFGFAALSTVVMVAIGGFIWRTEGVPGRVSDEVNTLDRARKDFNPDRRRCHAQDERPISYADKCVYGKSGVAPSIVVWGDSFAPEIALVLGREAEARGEALVYISYSNCPPTVGLFTNDRPACDRHNADVLSAIVAAKAIRTVVLVARYEVFYRDHGDAFFPTYERVVRELVRGGKQVLLTYPIPKPPASVPMMLARYAQRGQLPTDAFVERSKFEEANHATIAFLDSLTTLPGTRAVRPADLLCSRERCELVFDGRPLYYDDAHLSVAGAERVAPAFEAAFSAARKYEGSGSNGEPRSGN